MNVLYLTINPNRASTTVPTEGWFRCLASRGLRPVLVSNQVGAFHKWAREEGIPAYQVPLPTPSKSNPLPFARSLWKLRNLVRKHRIELIHCNEQDCYVIGSYLARWTRLPIVVSVHFTMLRGFCQWAFAAARCPDRVFFISQGNRTECESGVRGIVPKDRWRLLYNGIDLSEFRPDEVRRDRFRRMHGLSDRVAIGVACALRPRKQLEHLIEIAAQVNDERLRVVVAGGPVPGDEKYADELLAEGRRRLGDRLVLLGHLNELKDFYNGLDAFLNTSQEEACSISVMESLACGCPVLGYPSKSVDEQILPDGGEIVAQDDVQHLGARLANWLQDPQELQTRRLGARRQAEQQFDIRRLSDQLWDEYEQLLAERRPQRSPAAAAAVAGTS
jgi:glycosyltransferase involved in cell wall biosynthesis